LLPNLGLGGGQGVNWFCPIDQQTVEALHEESGRGIVYAPETRHNRSYASPDESGHQAQNLRSDEGLTLASLASRKDDKVGLRRIPEQSSSWQFTIGKSNATLQR
jgi:hypothetical protein